MRGLVEIEMGGGEGFCEMGGGREPGEIAG